MKNHLIAVRVARTFWFAPFRVRVQMLEALARKERTALTVASIRAIDYLLLGGRR